MKELALLFLRLGTTAFGGPAAHIAMMEDEVVRRRKWLTHEDFLDLVGATNLIPGPNSTEMALHIGFLRAGIRGLAIAGVCFIFPALLITLVLARLYVVSGALPAVQPFIAGVRPAVIAILLASLVRLGRTAAKKPAALAAGILAAALNLLGTDEIMLLAGACALGFLWSNRDRFRPAISACILLLQPLIAAGTTTVTTPALQAASLSGLGLFFLKVGTVLYGSGYVLIAFLQSGLVDGRHWLSQTQLFDAVAAGQITPGPVLSTATFIGYVVAGLPGAAVATLGIFLPSFLFVLASAPFIPKIRSWPALGGALDWVNGASLGLMLAVGVKLAATALIGPGAWIVFAAAAVVLVAWNINPGWIVLASACAMWLLTLLGR